MFEGFWLLVTMATAGGERRFPPLFAFISLCWKLVIDQFRQVAIRVGIIIRGKSKPFPLDVLECLLSPIVFLAEV